MILPANQDVSLSDAEIKQKYEDGELNKVSGLSQARQNPLSVHCTGPLASNEECLMVLPSSDL